MIEVIAPLIAAHWLADYPLQGEYLASTKFKALQSAEGMWALVAHAAIQGLVLGCALALLGSPYAVLGGLIVFATHWAIDLGKIRGLFGYSSDQFLHIAVAVAVGVLLQ